MNLKIIQTPNYILGVDKEAKKGEKGQWVIETHNPIVESVCQLNGDWDLTRSGYKDKLIIAHLPINGNKQLEGVWFLPEIEDKEVDLIAVRLLGEALMTLKTTKKHMLQAFKAGYYGNKPQIFPIEFEVEMEWVNNGDDSHDEGGTLIGSVESYLQPKLLNNIIQGKYKNEKTI